MELVITKADGTGDVCSVIAAPKRLPAGEQSTFQFIVPKPATTTAHIGQDVCEIGFCVGSEWSVNQATGEYECAGDGSNTQQIVITVT